MANNPIFQTRKGLNAVCPGARFKGALLKNDEVEYGLLEWLDVRPKPSWQDVEQASLQALRAQIANNLNDVTRDSIVNDFRSSIDPDLVIEATFEWQFDCLNLWLVRESGLFEFPYALHVGMNEDASPRYITLNDALTLNVFYIEMFGYVSGALAGGRAEKDKLRGMAKTELEEYRDPRI